MAAVILINNNPTKSYVTMKKSVTLIELIIAVTLLGVMVAGAVIFDLASRRMLASTGNEAALTAEMGMVLDHIGRNVSLASGDSSNSGIRWDALSNTLYIRQDNNNPGNYALQTWVRYVFTAPTQINPCVVANLGRIQFGPATGALQTLSERLLSTTVVQTCCNCTGNPCCAAANLANTPCPAAAGCANLAAEGGVRISGITLTDCNFTVAIADDAGRAAVYFHPLSHSWD